MTQIYYDGFTPEEIDRFEKDLARILDNLIRRENRLKKINRKISIRKMPAHKQLQVSGVLTAPPAVFPRRRPSAILSPEEP
jgi:hypothetical protein